MRKIIALAFISLDGVIQSPGSPDEDPENGFELGGWVAPFEDEEAGQVMEKLLQPKDLLLGRRTFEIWENYWPKHAEFWPGINEVNKYVLSKTRSESEWKQVHFLSRLEEIEALKEMEGSDIHCWGSGEVVQFLLQKNLLDELWIMIHPVILGKGKKLFGDGAIPTAFQLVESTVTLGGVIIGHYCKTGEVRTGTIGAS